MMIRSFAILLVLLFLLNGCRPVGTEPETKPNVTVPTATQEPTVQETPAAPQTPSESDMHVLQQYVDIIRFLYGREGPSHDSVYIDMQSYHDQGALNAGRNWLLEHHEVDQWEDFIPTYWDSECDWNRENALALFSCLEDVPIREDETKYDASDPAEERYPFEYSEFGYDIQGHLTRRTNTNFIWSLIDYDPADNLDNACLIYDENGVLTDIDEARYLVESRGWLRNAIYDEAGRLTGFNWESEGKTAKIEYLYDDQGRIIQTSSPAYPGAVDYTVVTYTYDEQGNMVREERRFHNAALGSTDDGILLRWLTATEYTYDENGVLLAGELTERVWNNGPYYDQQTKQYEYGYYLQYERIDCYTFEHDASGRLKSILIANGDTYYMGGEYGGYISAEAPYEYRLIEVIYGQYWFFNGK